MNPNPIQIVCALAMVGGAALAQEAAAPSSPNPDQDQTIVLTPFEVDASKDVGYKATNATSGTRLDTPIKDLPMPIEVITADFIKDTGATNLRDALSYSAGVVLDSQSDFSNPVSITHPSDTTHGATGYETQTVIKLRGFITDETLRNGFNRASPSDSINIDRIEILRGPSALLYGTGNLGGEVNYITKRPLEKPEYTLDVEGGTWDFFRSAIDFTGPVTPDGKVGYRLTAAAQRSDDYTDLNNYNYKFISPVVEFRPTKRTEILFDFERYVETDNAIGFLSVPTTVEGQGTSNGFNNYLPDPNPRTYRWSGPDTFRNQSDWNLFGQVTQTLADNLTLLVGGMMSRVDFDTRNVRAGIDLTGAVAPAGIPQNLVEPINFYPVGLNPRLNRFGVIDYSWTQEWEDTKTDQSRVELNYKLELGPTEHDFLLGRTDQSRSYRDYQLGLGTNTSLYSYKAFDDFSYFRWDPSTQAPLTPQINTLLNSWDSGTYLVYQGKFFKNRLQIVGGARYDRDDQRNTMYNLTGNTSSILSVNNSSLGKPSTKTSPQVGVSFAITPEISAYALYATGLIPNYNAVDGNGQVIKPATARSKEVGVKVDLVKGRISGTFSVYQIDRYDTPYYVFWAPNNTRHIFNPNAPISWEIGGARPGDYYQLYYENNPADLAIIQQQTALQYAPNLVNGANITSDISYGYGGGNNPSMDQGAYCPVNDESRGFDTQIILTPIDDLQVLLTYAHVNRKLTQGPALVKYLYGYSPYALWFVQEESPVDRYGGGPITNYADPHDTSTYNRSFGKGLSADDTPPDSFSFWAHYKVSRSALKGAELGFGGTWESSRDFSGDGLTDDGGFVKPTAGNLGLFAPPRSKLIFNGLLGYSFPVHGKLWSVRLNVYNLLDNQKRYGLNYTTPRSEKLSFTTTF